MKNTFIISMVLILNGLNAQTIALEFNSEDDAITVENDQLPSGSDPRTIEAWIKPGNDDGHNNVAFYGGSGCCGKHFGIRATTSTVYAFVGGAQRGITNLDLNDWHHVAFVLPENENRTAKIKAFLDGVEMTIDYKVGGNYELNTEGSVLEIGGNGFTGQIKQLRIWSTDFSEDEISAYKDVSYIATDHANYDKLVYQLENNEIDCTQEDLSIQEKLDSGCNPFDLIDAGYTVDELYGSTFGGGLVFYMDTDLRKGMVAATDRVHGKLAQYSFTQNSVYERNAPPTSLELWEGENNTELWVNAGFLAPDCPKTSDVLCDCYESSHEGFTDWFVSSKNEMDTLRINLIQQGIDPWGTTQMDYWTSSFDFELASRSNNDHVWKYDYNQDQMESIYSSTTNKAICIRYFSDE